MNMHDFFHNQLYLPKWMRDFHVQKRFFKMMHDRQQISTKHYVENINWIAGQVYTIDCFLWLMAQCGYTLRKNPQLMKAPNVLDVQKLLDEYEKKEMDLLALLILGDPKKKTLNMWFDSVMTTSNEVRVIPQNRDKHTLILTINAYWQILEDYLRVRDYREKIKS